MALVRCRCGQCVVEGCLCGGSGITLSRGVADYSKVFEGSVHRNDGCGGPHCNVQTFFTDGPPPESLQADALQKTDDGILVEEVNSLVRPPELGSVS